MILVVKNFLEDQSFSSKRFVFIFVSASLFLFLYFFMDFSRAQSFSCGFLYLCSVRSRSVFK